MRSATLLIPIRSLLARISKHFVHCSLCFINMPSAVSGNPANDKKNYRNILARFVLFVIIILLLYIIERHESLSALLCEARRVRLSEARRDRGCLLLTAQKLRRYMLFPSKVFTNLLPKGCKQRTSISRYPTCVGIQNSCSSISTN